MNVLIISSDKNYSEFIGKKVGASVPSTFTRSGSIQEAVKILEADRYDIVFLCMPVLTVNCPFKALGVLRPVAGDAKIIAIMDHIALHDAIQLVRQGMYTCLQRPFPVEELIKWVKKAHSATTLKKDHKEAILKIESKKIIPEASYVRGVSEAALKMFSQIDLIGPTPFSVIIYGETGTGKESVAQQIAKAGKPKGAYITVDCGCLSKELALSEMFGHEKGSFTGAVAQKAGAFELANNGTIFLDEIGNLDYEVQGYLLRAIQERKIKRVGGTVDIPVAVRIVVASNEDLAEAVKKGKFREDLYHRLNEFKITVPPLRSRMEDLPLLVENFVRETNIELDKNVTMPDNFTMLVLEKYHWKGNIRELRNVIRRACLLTPDYTPVTFLQLPDYINEFDVDKYEQEKENRLQDENPPIHQSITLSLIMDTLKSVNYNKTLAAALLGVDRKTIYNKLRKSNVDLSPYK